jgi:hypothetical protein
VRAWRVAVVSLALALAVVPLPKWWVEQWYSRGFYARWQPVASAASGVVSIALLDVAALALLVALGWWSVGQFRGAAVVPAIRRVLAGWLVVASLVYLWFLAAWGMNYRRVPLQERITYDSARLTRDRAFEFATAAVRQANALWPAAASDSAAAADASLVQALIDVQHRLGLAHAPTLTEPKRSLLGLYFRMAAIDGMTDPWFLEVIVNPDVLPSERPFVLAHEWAHLAGHADESEANFVAWLTCIRGSAAARYSGWLSAYQHVASGLPAPDRRALAALLSSGVAADLAAERARFARSSQRVRVVARGAYDTYLRANRVDEGIASYNAVVRLMLGASFDSQWNPQLR